MSKNLLSLKRRDAHEVEESLETFHRS